ncbi:hypothetical protein [Methylocystis sp.]|nr:hypothetical protein [Methylocystis sp.]
MNPCEIRHLHNMIGLEGLVDIPEITRDGLTLLAGKSETRKRA